MKTTVFLRVRGRIDFGGPLTELRAGSLLTDRSAVIAPYEHLPEGAGAPVMPGGSSDLWRVLALACDVLGTTAGLGLLISSASR
jgi:hypothetical protein